MSTLFSKPQWKTKRDESLDMARRVRDTLTDPNGHWGYPDNHINVRTAVGQWVLRARTAHEIFMGRRAVIKSAVVITPDEISKGELYAA